MTIQNPPEHYTTIGNPWGPEEIKEQGSRFIAYLYPASTAEEAEASISRLRKQYHDATHVCYAFRLGKGKEEYFRFNDDGEPSGTAGLPIYNEIKTREYYNILGAVIRYFGGIKLGTGGLVRAYSAAVRKVIEIARTITVTITKEVTLEFPFEMTGEIMQMVKRFSLEITRREYTDSGVSMKLAVPIARLDTAAKALSDMSAGRLKFF